MVAMNRWTMRGAVLGAAAAAAAGIFAGPALAAPAAHVYGAPVQARYHCLDDDTYWTFTWKIDAPVHAQVGGTVQLSVSGSLGVNKEGITIPAKAIDADLKVVLGGTQTGSVSATGLTNPTAQAPGEDRTMTGGTATVQLTSPGAVTFTPGTLTGHSASKTANCEVVGSAPVSSVTAVW
ncbi:hypothetical protein [Amycolatopsis sp. NPDC004079]|uniref:hypothetical protein n=1 Tax=Amycolatopsis sp. NPDC004079 TaxID=3154549 RepID=UPI0033B5A1BF